MNNKRYLKRIIIFYVLIFSFILIPNIEVMAEENKRFSIVVETDKADYKIDENINYKITVENISEEDINDILIENELSDSVEILDTDGKINGQKLGWNKDSLIKGEKVILNLRVKLKNVANGEMTENNKDNNKIEGKPGNSNSTIPKTGGSNSITIILIAVGVITIGYLLFKVKDKKKNISLVLAFVLTSSVILSNTKEVMAKAFNINESITNILKVEDKEIKSIITIKGTVNSKDEVNDDINDEISPTININNPSEDGIKVYEKNIIIEGTANDNIDISTIKYSVNGSELILANGTDEWRSNNIELELGENIIKVVAEDTSGNISEKEINITYSIGEIYNASDDEIEIDSELNIKYYKNQILITFKEEVSEDNCKKIIESINGEIIGFLYGFNDYQIKIKQECTIEELKKITDILNENDKVEIAILNTISSINNNIPNDPWNPWEFFGEWNEDNPSGSNWSLEAIKAKSTWEKYNDKLDEIKIGVMEAAVYTKHEDLEIPDNNDYCIEKTDDIDAIIHGTHVTGIIGAITNNNIGISGVVNKKNLYTFQMGKDFGIFQIKYGVLYLIANGVKVINISAGEGWVVNEEYQDPRGNDKNKEKVNEQEKIFTRFIKKLIKNKYDFIIVTSAGNYTIDTWWSGYFQSVSNSEAKSRIINVGSIGNVREYGKWKGYEISDFSNYGSNVDVVAPGEEIYSCSVKRKKGEYYSDYQNMQGTSMSAPFVTGVAAMTWAANPNLSAEEVKKIVVETAESYMKIEDNRNNIEESAKNKCYGLINAELAVKTAIEYDNSNEDNNEDNIELGIVLGVIYKYLGLDENGNKTFGPINNTKIEAISSEGNVESTVYSDWSGSYEMFLKPGKYRIRATYNDNVIIKNNIEVVKGEVKNCDIIFIYFDKNKVDVTNLKVLAEQSIDMNNDEIEDKVIIYGEDNDSIFKIMKYLVIIDGYDNDFLTSVKIDYGNGNGILGIIKGFKNISDFNNDGIKDINIDYSTGGNGSSYSLMYISKDGTFKLEEQNLLRNPREYDIEFYDDFKFSIKVKGNISDDRDYIEKYMSISENVRNEFIKLGYYSEDGKVINKDKLLKAIFYARGSGYDINDDNKIVDTMSICYRSNADWLAIIEVYQEYKDDSLIITDMKLKDSVQDEINIDDKEIINIINRHIYMYNYISWDGIDWNDKISIDSSGNYYALKAPYDTLDKIYNEWIKVATKNRISFLKNLEIKKVNNKEYIYIPVGVAYIKSFQVKEIISKDKLDNSILLKVKRELESEELKPLFPDEIITIEIKFEDGKYKVNKINTNTDIIP